MKKSYINGLGSISAQKTFDTIFLEEAVINSASNHLPVNTPIYKDYISPVALRRMAKGVKNGIVASKLAMTDAQKEKVDAILTGTGMGCLEDSEKFLKNILENNEEFLTPISFIQSIHNTVGTQIALGLQCKAYNLTYVNSAVSFESALLDAKLLIDENEASTVLVGAIDEITENTISLFNLAGFLKSDEHLPSGILNSKTNGVIYGEGATFFVVDDKKTTNTYAQLQDIEIFNQLETCEVEAKIHSFLKLNELNIGDIDAVILGYNGDAQFDNYYKGLAETCFQNTPQIYYKHLCGEFNTASAFGLWVGAKIIKLQEIPAIIRANSCLKSEYKHILLYNQFRGLDHSFTLLSKT